MRVRITYTVDVETDFRRAIRNWHGEKGLATRREIQEWFELYGASMNDDLMVQLEMDESPAHD